MSVNAKAKFNEKEHIILGTSQNVQEICQKLNITSYFIRWLILVWKKMGEDIEGFNKIRKVIYSGQQRRGQDNSVEVPLDAERPIH